MPIRTDRSVRSDRDGPIVFGLSCLLMQSCVVQIVQMVGKKRGTCINGAATFNMSNETKLISTTQLRLQARPKAEPVPYAGEPLPNVPNDLVVLDVLNLECDERLWVPQTDNVWFRPLVFNVSQGYFVNILRVRKSGILSRHRHTGPVHATTLRGRWHYLEHG